MASGGYLAGNLPPYNSFFFLCGATWTLQVNHKCHLPFPSPQAERCFCSPSALLHPDYFLPMGAGGYMWVLGPIGSSCRRVGDNRDDGWDTEGHQGSGALWVQPGQAVPSHHSGVTLCCHLPMEMPPVWLYEDYRNSPQRGLSRGVERLAASRLLGMKCLNSQCSWENPRAQTISPARSRPEGWAGHVVGTVTAVPTSISPHPSLQHSIKHWHWWVASACMVN